MSQKATPLEVEDIMKDYAPYKKCTGVKNGTVYYACPHRKHYPGCMFSLRQTQNDDGTYTIEAQEHDHSVYVDQDFGLPLEMKSFLNSLWD